MIRPFQHQESPGLRAAIAFFVLITCVRVWVGPIQFLDRAHGQLPDPGLQRKAALTEAKRTNQLLAEIKQVLETKVLNVRIVAADKKVGKLPVPSGAGK